MHACGQVADEWVIASWAAKQGSGPADAPAADSSPGVGVLTEATEDFASRAFTFEAWLTWPQAAPRQRETIAEAKGGDWGWRLFFNPVGGVEFAWRCGDFEKAYISDPLLDALRPGAWYHLAVVFSDKVYTKEPYVDEGSSALFLTPAGSVWPRCVGMMRGFQTPGPGPTAAAKLAVGRGVDDATPSAIRVGSAAFHRTTRGPGGFTALGGGPLPEGLSVDDDFEFASLGRAFTDGPHDDEPRICFESEARFEGGNYWWAFRLRGAAGRTLRFFHPARSSMAVTAFISEDGGATWRRPNVDIWRDKGGLLHETLEFTHHFETDDAILAASPIVDTALVDRWIADMQRRFDARVHTLATTPAGKNVQAVEIGNPDAPLVYMQVGQHSMMERIGFYLAAEAFEQAAADSELMKCSRWVLVPVVNMDSYSVHPRRGDRNMNRLWGKATGHHTIDPMAAWLRREIARTAAPVILDFHSGGVWRGHYALTPDADPGRTRAMAFEGCLRKAALDYTLRHIPLPGDGESGVFGDWAGALPRADVSLTVELAVIAAMTPDGPGPVTVENLRHDGRCWKAAIKAFLHGVA